MAAPISSWPTRGSPGTVVRLATAGVDVADDGANHVRVDVAAGEPWDRLVERAVEEGWSGVEALSGIPGLAGATPVQNVGAYGQEVAQTVVEVRAYDRTAGSVVELSAAECGFGYRTSRFKGADGLVVLRVSLRLARSPLAAPVGYAELARTLGTQVGRQVPSSAVRAAVLGLRREQGDGARPERQGHRQRRFLLHQPGAHAPTPPTCSLRTHRASPRQTAG